MIGHTPIHPINLGEVASHTPPRSALIVDLDGTLTPTNTLMESIIQMVKADPATLLRLPLWLIKGKAAFKEGVARQLLMATDSLPYCEPLVSYLKEEKKHGRRIILATAAHKSIAQSVATTLGVFDDIIATDAGINLKGNIKLEAIKKVMGNSDFIYAGDSETDIPIWQAAQGAILVGTSPSTTEIVRRNVPIEREFPKEDFGLLIWFRALRVHQWLKNLLLFVPLVTSFSFLDPNKLVLLLVAFVSFSLIASATYIINDVWDLQSDRAHPRKRLRPFASAKISILQGITVAGFGIILAFSLAATISKSFCIMLALYFLLTSAYSFVLKRYAVLDVVILSALYTFRILTGSVVLGVTTSFWLIGFSVFIFLNLAFLKRCAELVALVQVGGTATQGRDYRVSDLVVLWPLGAGTALSAIVVFGLFISAPETQEHYATPEFLWFTLLGLIYWIARLWIKTSRGDMNDDPVIYVIKDSVSRTTIFILIAMMLVAHYCSLTLLL